MVYELGDTGPTGPPTITVNTTVTPLEAGEPPTVQNEGDSENIILKFGIPRGAMGDIGATGPTGATGITGATGPTGPAVLTAYGSFISNTTQAVTEDGEVNLNLNLSVAPVGITFTADTSRVTLLNAGTYRIGYEVRTTLAVGATIILLQNGTLVANSGVPAQAAVGEISGVAIITAAANDTIAIAASGAGITLAAGTSAFLDIARIA